MTKTTTIASIIMGVICCVSMAQLMMPAIIRLLSVTMADSILH